jgi:hypothetical protein
LVVRNITVIIQWDLWIPAGSGKSFRVPGKFPMGQGKVFPGAGKVSGWVRKVFPGAGKISYALRRRQQFFPGFGNFLFRKAVKNENPEIRKFFPGGFLGRGRALHAGKEFPVPGNLFRVPEIFPGYRENS